MIRVPNAKRPRTAPRMRTPSHARSAPRERAAPHPLRLGPNLYIAHTQPGFESLAAEEIAARIRRARETTRRRGPARAGLALFFAPAAHTLATLRTVAHLFVLADY